MASCTPTEEDLAQVELHERVERGSARRRLTKRPAKRTAKRTAKIGKPPRGAGQSSSRKA